MKNLNLILVAIILAGVFYLSFTEKSPARPEGEEYEVLVIGIRNTYGICEAKAGSEPVTHKMAIANSKKGWMNQNKDMANYLQGLYDQGWELETNLDDRQILFKRKK